MTESGSPGDPGAPAGGAGAPSGGWSAPPPPVTVPGAAGFVYGDVLYRVIAIIIDAIILGIITFIVQGILGGIGLRPYSVTISGLDVNIIGLLLYVIISLALSVAYFVGTWTRMRGTLGMKALGMQIGNSGDGATLTTDQGVRRWIALFLPSTLSTVFVGFGFLGSLVSLAAFAWVIFLLWTTYKSPTKQGWHDHYANTMVVKAARVVA
jgi:uncharacterized RDD family membrane protein YckC